MITDGRSKHEPANSRGIGAQIVTGKTVSWKAIAIFRFGEQKIIEEWVTRDELAMILQFGLLEPARG